MRAPEPEVPESMSMTPMIDVTFQLIIFFMLVTDMASRQVERVTLPVADKATKDPFADPTVLIVNVRKDGSVWVDGRRLFSAPSLDKAGDYDPRKLEELFARRRADKRLAPDGEVKYPLLIRADRSADWQWVQMIMQIAAAHGGVTRVQMGATPKEGR